MINHVVLLKFKSGITDTDIEELEKMLVDLPNQITQIHSSDAGSIDTERPIWDIKPV